MNKVDSPLITGTGTIRIIDKDGKVKSELKLVPIEQVQKPKEPKETTKDEN